MTILITGATSGFGKAIALKFAAEGHRCIITGRREDRLQEATREIVQHNVEVLPLTLDVRDRTVVEDTITSLEARWQDIDILVNNAGLALGRDSFENADIDDWDTMIDTNVKGLLYMSKA